MSAWLVRLFLFKSTFQPHIFDRFFHQYIIFPKYFWLATKLATKSPISQRVLDFSPLYSYLVTIFYKIFSDRFLYFKIFQISIGAINCLLIYKICDFLFNRKVAIIAGLMSIFYKPLILYEFVMEPVTIIIFLNLLTVYLFIHAYQRGLYYETKPPYSAALESYTLKMPTGSFGFSWLLPGMTMGLSFICRPNILLFFFLSLLWIILLYQIKLRQMRKALFSILLGFTLITSPVLIRNYIRSHNILKPMMSSGQVFYQGNNPTAQGFYGSHPYLLKEMEMDPHINPDQEPDFAHELYREFAIETLSLFKATTSSEPISLSHSPSLNNGIHSNNAALQKIDTTKFWSQKAFNFITGYPWQYVRLLFKKNRFFWSRYEIHDILQVYYLNWEMNLYPLLTFGIIVPFALLGMILCINKIKRYLLLYAMAGNYFLSNLLFFVSSRQRLPVVPFLIPFAAYGLFTGMRYITKFIYFYGTSLILFLKGKSIHKKLGHNIYHMQTCLILFLGLLLFGLFFKLVNLPSSQIDHFEIMLHVNRKSRFHLTNAYQFMDQKEFQKAKKAFQLSYNLLPFHLTRVSNRFLGTIKMKYQKGIQFWDLILAHKKDNAYAQFNLGYLLFRNGFYDRAINEFKTLAEQNERGYFGYTLPFGDPSYFMGMCYEKKGEWKKAIAIYERLRQRYSGHPWILTRLIALYERIGEFQKALAEGKVLDQLDNPISSTYLLAEAYYQIEDYEKAVKMLETLHSKTIQKYAPFHFLLSACFARLGTGAVSMAPELKRHMLESAVKACGSGLKLKPHQNLIYPEIAEAYERLIAQRPDILDRYIELGQVYLNLGEIDKAGTRLIKAESLITDQTSGEVKEKIDMLIKEIAFLQYAFPAPQN